MTDDAPPDPSTLLARVTVGPAGAPAVAALVGELDVGPDDHVAWVGDVVAGPAEAVAVAVVRVDDGRAVVRAASAPDGLVDRLAAVVAALAPTLGCAEVAVADDGRGEPGPEAVVARTGLPAAGRGTWAVET